MDAYLSTLAQELAAKSREEGAPVEAPELDADLQGAILAFTRHVAHHSERTNAPIAAFMAGFTLGRMGVTDQSELVAFLRSVTGDKAS